MALVWVNAAIIVRLVQAAGSLVLSPAAPGLRLVPMADETANYAQIWLRRFAVVTVYGYLSLQGALLLGLPSAAYRTLLTLLGLLVTLLLVVIVLQNRVAIAVQIRGEATAGALRNVRARLAQVWHLLAISYVFLLFAIWTLHVEGGLVYVLQGTGLTAVVLVLTGLALGLLDRVFRHGLRVPPDLQARFPGLEARANRYVPGVQLLLRWMIYALALLAVLQAWGVQSFVWLSSEPAQVLGATAMRILGIVALSLAAWELASLFMEAYLNNQEPRGRRRVRTARAQTLLSVARKALAVALISVATLLILSELGVNIAPLLATAGVLGLAVGFGSQKLVQDVITGAFILLEDLFSVGDVIKVGDTAGLVEAVSIRNVRLRDLAGTVHTIPFSAISTVSNLTKEFSYYVFDVGVAYREDVDQVMDVLREIGVELQADEKFATLILQPLEVFGVDAFGDSAVIIKARIKTLPIQQWTVGREFNRRLKKRFDALDIEIPFPHQTIYFGADKSGNAPAARVRIRAADGPAPLGAETMIAAADATR